MILHLTLKKKWFDMILRGEKKEEYREIKPHWKQRLAYRHNGNIGGDFMDEHKVIAYKFKQFKEVEFKNGYSKNSPTVLVECRGIEIGISKSEWCSDGEQKRFIIKLGKILFHKNC